MAELETKLYNRADIVNFMGTTENATTFSRMKGFTENGKSLNSNTYERKYVDEKSSRRDTISYSSEIGYSFDRYQGDPVHDKIAEVHIEEQVGVNVPIVTVDFNKVGSTANTFKAHKRIHSINPSADGDGTDAYSYTGTFGSNGEIIKGEASTTDDWKTCSFTPKTEVVAPANKTIK